MDEAESLHLDSHSGIDQFATQLAETILQKAIQVNTYSAQHICIDATGERTRSAIPDEKCFSSERVDYREKDGDPTDIRAYAQELCCDIINGALQTLDVSLSQENQAKFDVIFSGRCGDVVSTERVELFYCENQRPTIVMKSTRPKNGNTTGQNRNKKKKTKYKRQLDRQLAKMKSITIRSEKFLSTIEETPPVDDIHDPEIVCPVCLDFYFHPYTCKPCDHKFCEPCLRRLAKYNGVEGKGTNCPICREPISHCQQDFDLSEEIKTKYPMDYRRRRGSDAHSRYMNHPLPSQPTQTVDSAIISHIIRRRRQERQRVRNPLLGFAPGRINIRRYISLAVFIVIIKALALMVIVAVYNIVLVE